MFLKVGAWSFPPKIFDCVKDLYVQTQRGKGAKQQRVIPIVEQGFGKRPRPALTLSAK